MNATREDPEARPGPAPLPPSDAETAGGGSGLEDVEEPPAVVTAEEEAGAEVEEPAAAPVRAEIDYKDRWLRAEAELQNFRRRAQRDLAEERRAAEEAVLLELVRTLDDLERAMESAREAGASESWVQGVALVGQRVRDFLGRQGVSVVEPLGQPFDPAFHEALLEVDAPEGFASGAVVQVVHKGYRRGDRALRAARVVVARGGGSAA